MNPTLLFALMATHAGQLYEVDSGLTLQQCNSLSAPGYITEFEISPGAFVYPDSSTRFDCVQWAPVHLMPGNTTPAADRILGNGGRGGGPAMTRYGQPAEFWNANPVDVWEKPRRKRKAAGGKTSRGRPRGS